MSGAAGKPKPPPPVPGAGEREAHEMLLPSRARRHYSRGAMLRRRWSVRAAKFLLPLGALSLLAAIALWPEIDRTTDQARLSFRRIAQNAADTIRVVQPRYQGVDSQNRPFNVTAADATQTAQDAPIMLEKPRADLMMSGGGWVLLESDSGRYDKAKDLLDLWGNVTLWNDNGTTLKTEVAHIQLKLGEAAGDRPVAAQGSFGTLTGDGFILKDKGADITFTGNTHAMLEGNQ